MISTRSSRSISSHRAWETASRMVMTGIASSCWRSRDAGSGVDVNVFPQFLRRRQRRFLGELYGIGDLLLGVGFRGIDLGLGDAVFKEHLLKLADRVVGLPLADLVL